MTKSIELVMNFETNEKKEFFQPQHIKGSVALDGLELGKKIEKLGDDVEPSNIREIAEFVSGRLYGGQFTAEELIDGIHANDVFVALTNQLASVFGDESDSFTKEKKA